MNFTRIIFCSLLSIAWITCHNEYIISNITYNKDKTSVTAELTFNSSSLNITHYNIFPLKNESMIKLIRNLSLEIYIECDSILHFIIKDKQKQRFTPNVTDTNYLKYKDSCKHNINFNELGLILSKENQIFSFELRDNNHSYYSLNTNNFLFTDTLIVFDSSLTTNLLFGFGERNTNFKLDYGRYTIWPNDTTFTYRDNKTGGYNLMGHQPIGLHKTDHGLFLGFIFMNTNAQDFIINSLQNNTKFNTNLEHRTIGGIIDYYITIGATADEAIANIHKVIGRPTIPPFWALGWHHCKWGYTKAEDIYQVYQGYQKYSIPIDTFWADIDMLYLKRNFQYDKGNFTSLPKIIKKLHNDKRKFVPIVDIGIPREKKDPYYKYGKNKNSFILSNYTKKELVTFVWPGKCVFPDFFSKNGIDLWKKGLKDFDDELNYDGIWLDMNEPGMLDVLPNLRGEYTEDFDPIYNKYEYLPYIPGERKGHHDLQSKGVSLNGYSSINNPNDDFYTIYNIRPLISLRQVQITNEYLQSTNRRPFILSRANTISHGKYAFHWLGDNNSDFNDLRASISGIFAYNIYGVPMTGADICGFHLNTKDTLCARWHVLGAFYPFSRNHNEIKKTPQEPWAFNTGFTLKAAIKAIKMKYSLLRYFYSQLMLISIGQRGSFFKPSFFVFPNDNNLYSNETMDTNIMVGDALMLIPNTNNDTVSYSGYFPNANWNMFPNGDINIDYNPLTPNKGVTKTLDGEYDVINVFLKGGSIIPFQEVTNSTSTTDDLRNIPIDLIINPDENMTAIGDIFYDNDEKDVIERSRYKQVKINYSFSNLFFTIENQGDEYSKEDSLINKIVFYRAKDILNKLESTVYEAELVYRNNTVFFNKVIHDIEYNTLNITFPNPVSVFDILLLNL